MAKSFAHLVPQHLLLINMGGIGDGLMFSPVIRQCRQALPQAKLTLLVEQRSQAVGSLLPKGVEILTLEKPSGTGLLEKIQTAQALWGVLQHAKQALGVDGVICCGSSPFIAPVLAASGIPLTIGFRSLTSGLLTAAAPLDTTGYAGDMYAALGEALSRHLSAPAPNVPTHPVIELDNADHQWFETTAKPHLPTTPWCLIHPGVSNVSVEKKLVKRWAPERWAQLIQQLPPQLTPVLAGGPDDTEQLNAIHQELSQLGCSLPKSLVGVTKNLRHLAICMAQADHVICCDSAPMHVAVGVDAKTTALFGDFPPHRLLPNNPRWQALTETGARTIPRYIEVPVAKVAQAVLGGVSF